MHARFERERRRTDRGAATEQLRGQGGPSGIRVAVVRREARQACTSPRDDNRTHECGPLIEDDR
ncbi:hypothetical protein GCM10009808_04390 [Microbacterium sediminicola]|uniref:Uncharacterized protein n=1 Tax=Microbacterium sediminicola TaxID=415210 RepID=A0ABN2HN18_9MICO